MRSHCQSESLFKRICQENKCFLKERADVTPDACVSFAILSSRGHKWGGGALLEDLW